MREAIDKVELQFHGDVGELVFVGCGNNRCVYVHPCDELKCIKILRAELAGTKGEKKHQKAEQREHNYYAFLQQRGVSFSHLARYYGRMRITREKQAASASVFDLIRDDVGGGISKTLDVELDRDDANVSELAGAMHELYAYMLRYKIISSLKLQNIVVQRVQHSPPKCVMIDNVRYADFIPICNYVDWFATVKIRRRWLDFLKNTLAKKPNNPVVQKVLQKAHGPLLSGKRKENR